MNNDAVETTRQIMDTREADDAAISSNFTMRKRLMVCEHLTDQELYVELKPRILAATDADTLMWRGKINNSGAPLIKFRHSRHCTDGNERPGLAARMNYRVAHIVMLLDGNYPTADKQEASHICHEALCLDPSHLIWESHRRNGVRNACIHAGKCLSPEEFASRVHWRKDPRSKEGGYYEKAPSREKSPCSPPCLINVHGPRRLHDGRSIAAAAPRKRALNDD